MGRKDRIETVIFKVGPLLFISGHEFSAIATGILCDERMSGLYGPFNDSVSTRQKSSYNGLVEKAVNSTPILNKSGFFYDHT